MLVETCTFGACWFWDVTSRFFVWLRPMHVVNGPRKTRRCQVLSVVVWVHERARGFRSAGRFHPSSYRFDEQVFFFVDSSCVFLAQNICIFV